jgi:hypothetical protein
MLLLFLPIKIHAAEQPIAPPQKNVPFDASFIPKSYEVTKGDYLKIKTIYENEGNVPINPQIELKIEREGETAYRELFSYPKDQPPVNPHSSFEIPDMEIPTSNLDTGEYNAIMKVSQGEYSIEKRFDFSIGMVKSASAVNNISPSENFWQYVKTFVETTAILSSLSMLQSQMKKIGFERYFRE